MDDPESQIGRALADFDSQLRTACAHLGTWSEAQIRQALADFGHAVAGFEARVQALEAVVDGLLHVVERQSARRSNVCLEAYLGVGADVVRHARPPDRGRRLRAVHSRPRPTLNLG